MLAPLAVTVAALGFSVWHYRRRRHVLQLGVWFNICAVAYMGFGLALALGAPSMQIHYGGELAEIGLMCLAAVFGFNVAYLAAGFRAAPVPAWPSGYLPSYTSLLVVVVVALAFEAAAVLLVGPLHFVFTDRVQRFAALVGYKELFYMANLLNVCLPFSLLRYWRLGQRRDLTMAALLLAHGLLLGILTISRFDLAIVLLVGLFLLERAGRLRPGPLLCILAASFAATLFYKPMLYPALLATDYPQAIDFSEYTNWIRHTLLLFSTPDTPMPHSGYGLALKSLFVPKPEQDSLAEWFFVEFFPERAILFPALGYGFSGVWEGYSANGLAGVAAHFAFFGAAFGLLERSTTPIRLVLTVFALILTYRLFRSEAYNFVKTYAWYFVYPTLAIIAIDRFLAWASGPSGRIVPALRPGRAPRWRTPEGAVETSGAGPGRG